MKKVQFSDEQIMNILKLVEIGQKVGDVCRAHGISETTYYCWKAKYGGMEVRLSLTRSCITPNSSGHNISF